MAENVRGHILRQVMYRKIWTTDSKLQTNGPKIVS